MIKLPHRLREFLKDCVCAAEGHGRKEAGAQDRGRSNELRPHIGRTFRRKLKGGQVLTYRVLRVDDENVDHVVLESVSKEATNDIKVPFMTVERYLR